jgi:RHS repeat-associated protein
MKGQCGGFAVRVLGIICLIIISPVVTFGGDQLAPITAPTVEVDPHSGSANLPITLAVPQGRAGIQPSLSLTYNSSRKNGIMGMGWGLNLGAIRVATQSGAPDYDSEDTYILVRQGGQQKLVFDPAAGFYRSQIEGAFMKIEKIADAWQVTDQKGVTYLFGSEDASRMSDPADPSRIFQWYLDRVEDVHGNYMEVSYQKEDNYVYPRTIRYTGNADTNAPPFAEVTFEYESRQDALFSYLPGFRYQIDQRLSEVTVTVDDQLIRKYAFTYTHPAETRHVLLTGMRQYGSDGVSALPEVVFSYSVGDTRFGNSVNVSHYPSCHIGDGSVKMLDMNGDSLVDMVKTHGTNGSWDIYINQSNTDQIDYAAPFTAVNPPELATTHPDIKFADVNGDGLTDVINGAVASHYVVHINNGVNGFQPPVTVSHAPNHNIGWEHAVQFMDMNADGLADMLATYWGHRGTYAIYMNTGKNDFAAPVTAVNPPDVGCEHPDYRFADFNADGLKDVIVGTDTNYRLYINNGTNGYAPAKSVSHNPQMILSSGNLVHCVDMNADGLADLLETYSGNNQDYKIYFNNGREDFTAPVTAAHSPIRGADNENIKLMDMNGDGLTDVFLGIQEVGWSISLNNGINGFEPAIQIENHHATASLGDWNIFLADINGDFLMDMLLGSANELPYKVWVNANEEVTSRPEVLTAVDNSAGAQIQLQYGNTPVEGLGGLYLLNTVTSKTITTDLGAQYTTQYVYDYGRWDREDREFRGFGLVTIKDADGNYTETDYLQDDIYKGRVDEQRVFSAAGHLYQKTVNTWNHEAIADGIDFVYLKRTDQMELNGDSTGRRTAKVFDYEQEPQYGHVTQQTQLGEVDWATGEDIGSDTRMVQTAYVHHPDKWLMGVPSHVIVKNNAGAIVSQTWFSYDGQPHGAAPVIGLLTAKEQWAGDAAEAVNPVTRYTYDRYGNVVMTTDPLQNTTTLTYDPDYHMFPVKTTNALDHAVESQYYGVNGIPLESVDGTRGLWGQVKKTTDVNDQVERRIYDVFGRLTASIGPFDSIQYPSMVREITHYDQYTLMMTRQRARHGQPETIDVGSIYDGLGRLIQSKSKSETQGQYVISGQSELNTRGMAAKKYLPYFTDTPLDTLDPIDPNRPYTETEYDCLGRVTKVIHPDGTFQSIAYANGTTATYDENGHKQESDYDAYGRLIEKRQYTGADGRSPHYPQSPYTLYATTRYTYDSEGNLIQTQDAHGNVTTIAYDQLGRKVSMDDPDMGFWQYAYDLNGNLIAQTDAKGRTVDFTHDELNRLTQKSDHLNMTVDYTYDDTDTAFSKGRLTQAEYPGGLTEFAYDELGREVWSNKVIAAIDHGVERGYDALDQLIDITYPGDKKVYYQYDRAGQIESISTDADLLPQASAYPESVPSPMAQYRFNDNTATATVTDAMAGGYHGRVMQTAVYTGDMTSGGSSSASSCLLGCANAGYSHGKAFDNIKDVWDGWVANNVQTGWLRYDFGQAQTVTRYAINARGASAGNPRNWAFQGYDGAAWVTLDSRSGQSWTYPETKTFSFDNPFAYSKYRLNITANGGHPEVGLTELQMMTYAPLSTSDVSVNGKVGQAFAFNGESECVNADGLLSARHDTTGTIAFWARPAGLAADDTIFSVSNSDGAQGLEIIAASDLEFALTTGSASLRVRLPQALLYDTWSHVAVVQDGTSVRGFVNGAEVSLSAVASSLGQGAWLDDLGSLDNARIGSRNRNNEGEGRFYKGILDDFRYYNVPLTADEVNALYKDGAGTEARNPQYYLSRHKNAQPLLKFALARGQRGKRSVRNMACTVWDHLAAIARWCNPFYAQYAHAMAPPPPPPDPPVVTQIDEYNNTVTLHWDPPSGEAEVTGYYVKYGTRIFSGSLDYSTGTMDPNTRSHDFTVPNGTTYYFVLYAKTSTHGILESEEVSATSHAKPLPPELTKAEAGDQSVFLQWTPVQHAIGYTIKYGISGGGSTQTIDAGGVTQYTVTSLSNGTAYDFVVSPVDAYYGDCGNSNVKSATPHGPPEAPVINGIDALDSEAAVRLNEVAFAQNYQIHYGTASGNYTQSLTVGATSPNTHTITGLSNGQTYYFAATAINNDGESGLSNEMSATPENIIQPPEAPVLVIAEPGQQEVTLTWEPVADAVGYKVQYGTNSGGYSESVYAGDVTTYTVTGLADETTYYFAVAAYNEDGDSGLSNELSAQTNPAGSGGDTLFVTDVDYNASGQITRIVYGNGTITTRDYNPLSLRLTRVYTVNANGQILQDLNYTYDAAGNILGITDNSEEGTNTQSFQYDALNRLTQATGAAYGTKTYAYDAVGNLTVKDGLQYTYGENGAGPHAVTSLSDGSAFSYDANGNMIRQSRDNVVTGYAYDTENRLTQVTKDGIVIAAYRYDGDGGRTEKHLYGVSEEATCFLGGTKVIMADGTRKNIEDIKINDRVLSYDEKTMEKVPAKVTKVFNRGTVDQYLIINERLRVTANHLFYSQGEWRKVGTLSLADPLLDLELKDVAIHSVKKIQDKGTRKVYNIEVNGSHNYFVAADGDASYLVHNKMTYGNPAGEDSITYYVGSLYEEANGQARYHIFLGDMQIASISENEVTYYYRDHLGGTNVTTDADGNLKELIEYKPYGEFARREMYGDGADVAWFYFTGKPKDDETGLYYYGARYYDPVLGRFITADTMVPHVKNPQAFNRYSYAGNNPVRHLEDGHFWWVAPLIGAILGGASAAVNDQPVWQGAIMGAVGGALVAGGGALAVELGFSAGWGAVGGGMIAGMANSAVNGGELWMGALTGGLGAGIGYGLGSWASGWNEFSFWGGLGAATLAGSIAGGVGAELSGGRFGEGAWMGAAYSSAGFLGSYSINSLDPRAVKAREYERSARQMRALNVKKNDMVKIETGGRPVGGTPASHRFISGWEMGPDGKPITTTNTAKDIANWKTYQHTQSAFNNGTAKTTFTDISFSGLVDAIELYNSYWAGSENYNALSYNSNYAVNTVIYAAGGNSPGVLWAPEFRSPTMYYTPNPYNN